MLRGPCETERDSALKVNSTIPSLTPKSDSSSRHTKELDNTNANAEDATPPLPSINPIRIVSQSMSPSSSASLPDLSTLSSTSISTQETDDTTSPLMMEYGVLSEESEFGAFPKPQAISLSPKAKDEDLAAVGRKEEGVVPVGDLGGKASGGPMIDLEEGELEAGELGEDEDVEATVVEDRNTRIPVSITSGDVVAAHTPAATPVSVPAAVPVHAPTAAAAPVPVELDTLVPAAVDSGSPAPPPNVTCAKRMCKSDGRVHLAADCPLGYVALSSFESEELQLRRKVMSKSPQRFALFQDDPIVFSTVTLCRLCVQEGHDADDCPQPHPTPLLIGRDQRAHVEGVGPNAQKKKKYAAFKAPDLSYFYAMRSKVNNRYPTFPPSGIKPFRPPPPPTTSSNRPPGRSGHNGRGNSQYRGSYRGSRSYYGPPYF